MIVCWCDWEVVGTTMLRRQITAEELDEIAIVGSWAEASDDEDLDDLTFVDDEKLADEDAQIEDNPGLANMSKPSTISVRSSNTSFLHPTETTCQDPLEAGQEDSHLVSKGLTRIAATQDERNGGVQKSHEVEERQHQQGYFRQIEGRNATKKGDDNFGNIEQFYCEDKVSEESSRGVEDAAWYVERAEKELCDENLHEPDTVGLSGGCVGRDGKNNSSNEWNHSSTTRTRPNLRLDRDALRTMFQNDLYFDLQPRNADRESDDDMSWSPPVNRLQRSASLDCDDNAVDTLEVVMGPGSWNYKNKSELNFISESKHGLERGLAPTVISSYSTSQCYYLRSNGTICAVFKPWDQEAGVETLNSSQDESTTGKSKTLSSQRGGKEASRPSFFSDSTNESLSGDETENCSGAMRRGILPGEGCVREVAAYLLDHQGFSGVPPTGLVRVFSKSWRCSSGIALPAESDDSWCFSPPSLSPLSALSPRGHALFNSPLGSPIRNSLAIPHLPSLGPSRPGLPGRSYSVSTRSLRASSQWSESATTQSTATSLTLPSKLGSLQAYVSHHSTAEDVACTMLTPDMVQRIAVLDIRIFNADRHAGNILLQTVDDDAYNDDDRDLYDEHEDNLDNIEGAQCLFEDHEEIYEEHHTDDNNSYNVGADEEDEEGLSYEEVQEAKSQQRDHPNVIETVDGVEWQRTNETVVQPRTSRSSIRRTYSQRHGRSHAASRSPCTRRSSRAHRSESFCEGAGKSKLQLVPIDHGLCLPRITGLLLDATSNDQDLSSNADLVTLEWLEWPQVRQPVLPEVRHFIDSLDDVADARLLREALQGCLGVAELLTMQVCTRLLQAMVNANYTLFDVGMALQKGTMVQLVRSAELPADLDDRVQVQAFLSRFDSVLADFVQH